MFAIVMDSTSSTPTAQLNAQGVAVVPLTVRFGEEEYVDGETMMPEAFYTKMVDYLPHGLPKTACPTPGKFEETFRAQAQGKEGVVCITISGGLSGTYESACLAAKACAADGIRVEVINSLAVTQVNSMMCEKAVQMRDAGATLDEVAEHLRKMAAQSKTIVALDQLDNLVKGGRVGKAAGVAAGILNLKPVLILDKEEGVVSTACKSRGVKGLIKDCTSLVKSIEEEYGDCVVRFSHADALDRVALFEKAFDDAGIEYDRENIGWIGPVIGTYAGYMGVLIATCPKVLM